MTKIVKKIAAVGVAVMMMASISAIGASAVTDTASGSLAGRSVKGNSTVTSTKGSSSTEVSANTTAKVTGKYTYINTTTLETGSTSKSKGYMYSASVSFDAPSGCRSVKENGSHEVTYSSQTWTADTCATY